MKLIQGKDANVNYLAKIVTINGFEKHPNPEVTKMKVAVVDGYSICVGIDSQVGKYIYFPTSSQINPEILSFLNLFSDKSKNRSVEKSGFFGDNGRVKAIKLKGFASDGFLLPIDEFNSFLKHKFNATVDFEEVEFDTIEHNDKEFWVNRKLIVINENTIKVKTGKRKSTSKYNKVIKEQFKFHIDTVLLQKQPEVIKPNDNIHISHKFHGTSGISAYVLCKRPLNIFRIIGNLIKFKKWDTPYTYYDYLYSSRSVIKNKEYNPKVDSGFYGIDVWAEADKILRPHLTKGTTFYYEIVGFLPNGKYIQKGYDYGCVPPTEGETYTYGKHFCIYIYRITNTDVDGYCNELNPILVRDFCLTHGLHPVEMCYCGMAEDLYPELDASSENWSLDFLNKLSQDKTFYMEKKSPHCKNSVPHEGVVIKKIESPQSSNAWKVKCFAFKTREGNLIDSGESNIEDDGEQ